MICYHVLQTTYMLEGIEHNHYQRVSHSTSSHYHVNQQMALLIAAQKECRLIITLQKKLGGKLVGINMQWIISLKLF